METPVRIAVVGCGAHAQVAHIPAIRHCRRAELVALCDPDVRKLNHLCRLHNVPRRYVEFEDLTRDADIDAVIIATPNHLHAPMAIAAIEYGKDVLCEMPLGLNAEEAGLIIDAARRKGRRLMPCLNTRLRPDVQTIKKFIDGGELGRLYYCKTGWLQGRDSWSLDGWRGQSIRAGGGAFLSLGAPLLDFSLWLMAPAKPLSITGFAHRRSSGPDVEDTAFAMLRFDNDLHLTVEVGWSLLMEKDFTYFNAFGTSGAALLNPIQIHKQMHGHLVNVTPKIPVKGIQRASYRFLVDLFVDALLSGEPSPIDPAGGLVINQVADAFYRSNATGSEVKLPSSEP